MDARWRDWAGCDCSWDGACNWGREEMEERGLELGGVTLIVAVCDQIYIAELSRY